MKLQFYEHLRFCINTISGMIIFLFFIAHWYLSLFAQTFFHHRYAAHGMFKMSKIWEKLFFIFSFVSQGSSYLSPYIYGVLHRMHHAYTDTAKDPHSPTYDPNVFAMMWRTKTVYQNIHHGSMLIEDRFKEGVPTWFSFEKIANSWTARIVWAVLYGAFYYVFATSWWHYLLLPLHFVMGPLHGAIINWFAHKYGYTNFKMNNTAKNLLPFDFLMLGESYHNNHHKNGNSPNFGHRWFEIDPVYPIIKLLNRLGVIQLNSR